MSIIVQQDATIRSFIIFSADSPTCFRWYPHPLSGAHSNCSYDPCTWTVANTVWPGPDAVITVWMCSWSETCRAVCRKCNKTAYTGCFTTLGHNCRRWFPRSLWSKSSYKHVSDFGRLRSYDRFLIPVHALVWTASISWWVAIFSHLTGI